MIKEKVTYGEKADHFIETAKIGAYKMLCKTYRFEFAEAPDDNIPDIFMVTSLMMNQTRAKCQFQVTEPLHDNIVIEARYNDDEDKIRYNIFEWKSYGDLVQDDVSDFVISGFSIQ